MALRIAGAKAEMIVDGAHRLEEIPFDKRLKLAEVGDEEAQMAVASAYEQGTKPRQKPDEAQKAG